MVLTDLAFPSLIVCLFPVLQDSWKLLHEDHLTRSNRTLRLAIATIPFPLPTNALIPFTALPNASLFTLLEHFRKKSVLSRSREGIL